MLQPITQFAVSAHQIALAIRRLRESGREYVVGQTACDASGTAKVRAEVELTLSTGSVYAVARTILGGVVIDTRVECIGTVRDGDATLAAGIALLVREAAGDEFNVAYAHSRSVFNRTAEVA